MDKKLKEKTRQLQEANMALQREIEMKNQAEAAKRAAELLANAKSEFIATVSHEIRT